MFDEVQPSGRNWDQHAYKIVAASALGLMAVGLMAVGTVAYRLLEDWSWVDALYFSVVAITTVGFGDITPSTDGSKLFTIVYILAGISLVTTYLNLRLKHRAAQRHEKH